MSAALDLGVTIERIRVRVGSLVARRPPSALIAGYVGPRPDAPPHDHRVVIRELRLEIEAAIDEFDARRLAAEVARAVAAGLAALQDRRRPRIAASWSAGGPIRVESLRVHLRGEPARHPPSHQICSALLSAYENEVRDAS